MQSLSFFLRLFHGFSIRQIRRHPWRAATVLAGVALGAAVFGSVRIAVNASLDSFTRSMNVVAGSADVTVTRPGGRVSEDLVAVLLRHPDVRAASPFMSTYTRAREGSGRPFLLIGLDPILDRPLRDWTIPRPAGGDPQWARLLTDPFTLVVGAPLASGEGWTPGGTITLRHRQGPMTFSVLAELVPQGLGMTESGRVVLTDIATFQEFTGTFGEIDRKSVV